MISARHRARLLVLAARTHSYFGEPEKAGQAAARALTSASEAGDNWAMGWALLMLALETSIQGHLTDALPLFDRALAATQADPDLADLRLLVQVNQAVTLGELDRHEEALAAAGQARDLAHQAGATLRIGQAHGALSQLLFQTGRWDEALAELGILPDDLKEPAAACCDFGLAAVISFHRGDALAARRHLAAAEPYADRLGRRLVGPLALARSLDREHDGALPEALATLTGEYDPTEQIDAEEMEDLLGDAVRLAIQVGDLAKAQAFSPVRPLPSRLNRTSRAGRRPRCTVTACLTMTPPSCSRPRNVMTTPAGRCKGQRRWRRRPGSSPTPATATRRGPRSPGPRMSTTPSARRATSTGSWPSSAAAASGAARGPATGGRAAAGTASPPPRPTSPRSSRKACPTPRSPPGYSYPRGPSAPTSPASSRSSISKRGPTSPANRPCEASPPGDRARLRL